MLTFVALKTGWYFEGNEAVAATKQVLKGDAYVVGRATGEAWKTAKSAIELTAVAFTLLTVYFFISETKNSKTKTQ